MNITWNGFSSFEIDAKTSNADVKIVTDPYQNTTGLRFPRTLSAEVLLLSHDEEDANNREAVLGNPSVIDLPGEFEVKDVFVFGIAAPLAREVKGRRVGNLLFRIEAEGMRLAHLGALDRALTDEELQQLENVDVLMIPVGGGRVMSAAMAAEVISQIEPRVVIPMTHAVAGAKESLGTVEDFCKSFGACRREEMNKFKFTRKDLPEEDMVIVSLTR
ncbi:MBL fold metallo-hydrolase [Candidatus Uhrbacteria bacterium]|nr:MBL fold metallo-hydrolase [Candidatus Uhrbacteria bacterium]